MFAPPPPPNKEFRPFLDIQKVFFVLTYAKIVLKLQEINSRELEIHVQNVSEGGTNPQILPESVYFAAIRGQCR